MIWYDLGDRAEAFSTNIGEERGLEGVVTPAHQAHSTSVAVIPDEMDDTYGVDALITDQPVVWVGVRTADCVPILLYDCQRQAVAAIHSGWKGTANNIISHAIERMAEQYGCNPGNMKAVIGPCIHVEAFEVGDEVYDTFSSRGYASFAQRMANPYVAQSTEKWHIDLVGICKAQLKRMGVPDVYASSFCTYAHHDKFYSYRYSKSADKSLRIYTAIKLKDR